MTAQLRTPIPPAYIETAEFDCLHDEALLYAQRLRDQGAQVTVYETKATVHGYDFCWDSPITQESVGGAGGGHGGDAGKVMGRFRRPFPFQNLPPLRSAKGSLLNLSCVGSTRRAQNLSMYQGVIQLCPGVGAGAGRRRSACQRHRSGSHPQAYTTDKRCPWRALGSSKCGTRRSASARSWRPSRRDNPFVSIGILPIYVKQRSMLAESPSFSTS